HYFLRFTMPNAFGDVTEDELHRFGNVLPLQYGLADGMIGHELAALQPGDLDGEGSARLTAGKKRHAILRAV
ncbi:MAG: hypothetical protein HGA90_03090, partial [Alphaproteobacteria bacterium]|nr:hypothetical protein [Alphaproteobacteria bacterium]